MVHSPGRAIASRCSCTVSDGNTPRSCGTHPNPSPARRWGGTAASGVPRHASLPLCKRVIPMSVRSKVVLPTPLRPRSARLPPSRRVKETSSSTTDSPYPATRPCASRRSGTGGLIAEIDLAHARVGRDLPGRSLGEDRSGGEHRDPLGEAEDEIHVVLDEEHAHLARQ